MCNFIETFRSWWRRLWSRPPKSPITPLKPINDILREIAAARTPPELDEELERLNEIDRSLGIEPQGRLSQRSLEPANPNERFGSPCRNPDWRGHQLGGTYKRPEVQVYGENGKPYRIIGPAEIAGIIADLLPKSPVEFRRLLEQLWAGQVVTVRDETLIPSKDLAPVLVDSSMEWLRDHLVWVATDPDIFPKPGSAAWSSPADAKVVDSGCCCD